MNWPRPCLFFVGSIGLLFHIVDPRSYLGIKEVGTVFFVLGFGGLFLLHGYMYIMIFRMCKEVNRI